MESMTGPALILVVIFIIVIMIFAYFRKNRIPTKPPEIPAKPPSGHKQVVTKDELPKGAQPFEKTSSFSSLGFEFVSANGDIQLGNIPDGVTPHLLPVSPEDLADWEKVYKDGFDSPIDVAGNLVFVDDKTQKLVTIFKSPIKLKFTYSSSVIKLESSAGYDEVAIPVFLYSVTIDDINTRVWKPFQNHNNESNTMTVEFKAWGDTPIGVSKLKVPKEWGPP